MHHRDPGLQLELPLPGRGCQSADGWVHRPHDLVSRPSLLVHPGHSQGQGASLIPMLPENGEWAQTSGSRCLGPMWRGCWKPDASRKPGALPQLPRGWHRLLLRNSTQVRRDCTGGPPLHPLLTKPSAAPDAKAEAAHVGASLFTFCVLIHKSRSLTSLAKAKHLTASLGTDHECR